MIRAITVSKIQAKMSEAAILRGYHFMPSEEELIGILMAFLEYRAQGNEFPQSPVAEKVLYGDNATPWKIFSEDEYWESSETVSGKKQVAYVFTNLSAMSAKKKARTAGCGTWEGQTGIKEIKNWKGEILGLRKLLSYNVEESSESQPEKAKWRMHEYALAGVSLEEMNLKQINVGNYVICKITRDYTKYENPTKNQILSKRKSEVGAESGMHQNKKLRRLMELVNYEAQELVNNNTYPIAAAEAIFHPQWVEKSTVNDSYPLFPAEARSEAAKAELTTSSNPEDDMEWLNSLDDLDIETTFDMEFIRNVLWEDDNC